MALGADSSATLRLVLARSMMLVAAGTAIGLAASVGATRVMSGLLYEVSPLDPVVFVTVAALLAAAGFFASLFPARRATRVDPVVALRVE
jgi:ABC-type antimicrobial peptide transport system permease subunit